MADEWFIGNAALGRSPAVVSSLSFSRSLSSLQAHAHSQTFSTVAFYLEKARIAPTMSATPSISARE